ncbi:MAG: 16S rRNA (cytosine(1402)-N(4))-methyltransferase, partial [Psychrobacter sp.]
MSLLNNKPEKKPLSNVNHSETADDTHSDELSFVHDAVLLPETVAAVLGVKSLPKQTGSEGKGSDDKSNNDQNSLKVSGIYVDATFGRGGHSRLLLSQLADDAQLIVFDKDPTAISVAQELASTDRRVKVVHDSFATLTDSLAAMGITEVDGLMADLGISSPQIDDGSRGFSFMRDGAV